MKQAVRDLLSGEVDGSLEGFVYDPQVVLMLHSKRRREIDFVELGCCRNR
jgi:hypothetical protein